ncbi:monooxygenase [Xylaria bambusicola]|uniref:monooxygenase n=1 Tax=Xylaria bambusicola TaxID=326684 RepID=UPI002008018D|nr:monooxygenase [Xylaria bambusicola]KAI0505186.1 monooxygenase [Xylaria bambusicola]
MSAPAPIAIIGGGPCGLTFARLLSRAGINYVVFERDDSPEPQDHHSGGTLDLHTTTGIAALDAAGLRAEFENFARYEAAVFTVQDAQGGNRYRADAEGDEEQRPEIDRVQLRKILLDSVPAERVKWGKTLESISRGEGGGKGAKRWVLKFKDGSEESGFRMVVGCDGASSAVRPLITPAKPQYSGKTYIEGRISPSNPQYVAAQDLVGPGNSAAMGAGRALLLQQMSDRSYRAYIGIEESDTSLTRPGGILDFATDIETSRTALLERYYADWAPHLRAFIEDAEAPFRVWPLYTLDVEAFAPEAQWTRAPGVTLLGDAAHVTLPNGEGVNLAMLDALKLFEALTAELGGDDGDDDDAVERAIVAYEADMRTRAQAHIEDGIQMCGMMFQADGAEKMIAFFKSFEDAAKAQAS